MEVREESQRLHQLAYGYTPGNIESLGRIYCSWVLSFAFDIAVLVANTCNFSRGDRKCWFQRSINHARLSFLGCFLHSLSIPAVSHAC